MLMGPCARVLCGDARGQDNGFAVGAPRGFAGPEKLDMLVAAKGDRDIIASAGSHVDDLLIGGKESGPRP
eukprot:5973539-Pyramimonas_sp.AAC.1